MSHIPDKPWERQNKESGQAYEAFALYRDMGRGRTVSAVVKKLKKSRSLLDRWKVRWDWESRVAAYDKDLEQQAKDEAIKDRKSMINRHIKIALQVQKKALKALDNLDVDSMSPKDIKDYIRMATDLERLSRTLDDDSIEAISQEESFADKIVASYKKRKNGDSNV